jgi:MoxR-like ATPase
MNPPPTDGNAFDYEGAEPLDVALADRFAFVLEAPTLDQLNEADRRAVLLGQGRPDPDAARKLQQAVAATKQHLPWAERPGRARRATSRVAGAYRSRPTRR